MVRRSDPPMSQAQPLQRSGDSSLARPPQRQKIAAPLEWPFDVAETTTATTVTNPADGQPRRKTPGKGRPRLGRQRALIPFALGLSIGYGLAGPVPHLIGTAMASLHQGSQALATMVAPPLQGKILVLGTDQVATNTDVMFTAELKNGRTELTQIPRDTYIESEKYGTLKANALYESGGLPAVEQEISKLLGEPIERYLIVNLDAARHVADALGGAEVDVPKRMVYNDRSQGLSIDLYPGRQLLKGKELEGFLRFRHDEMGDLGRMDRQRLVLNEVFRKLAQPSALVQLPELLRIAGKDIKTDLSPVELASLMTAIRTTKLASQRLAGQPYWHDNLSYWMPDLNPNHTAYKSQEPPP
jgi:LCP family protein required for cell wall assembly